MDWLDLLAVQGTLKSLLQHHSSSILWCSLFFTVQLSHVHVYWKYCTFDYTDLFVGKVMSLLFKVLSRFVIAFFPRSKHLLVSWLQSPSAVILEPPAKKVCHCFLIYLPWSDGTRCHDLRAFECWVLSQLFTLLFHPHQEALKFFFAFFH